MKIRKFIFKLIIIFSILQFIVPRIFAQTSDFTYELIDDGTHISIIGYTGTNQAVNIPEIIDGKSVTSIGENAFARTEITSIIIPASVISIGKQAFTNSNISEITMPGSLNFIGSFAFAGCQKLTSILIPAGVKTLKDAFIGCPLTEINVSQENSDYSSIDGVLYNKDRTIIIKYPEGRTNESYIIPDGVTRIDDNAFETNHHLHYVTIPNSVETIGKNAFNSSAIYEIAVPAGVSAIGDKAFGICVDLKAFNVDKNNTNYSSQDGVLYNKDKTQLIQYPIARNSSTFNIPDSVTSINDFVFVQCDNLTNINIPNSVKTIGSENFNLCQKLTSIIIPKSVTSIDTGSFILANALHPEIDYKIYVCKDSYAEQYAKQNMLEYGILTESKGIDLIKISITLIVGIIVVAIVYFIVYSFIKFKRKGAGKL